MHDMFPRLRDFIIPVALVIILSLVSMKLCPFSAPPVVLNAVVVDVSDTLHASQIIRGSILNRMPYKISLDRDTGNNPDIWSKHVSLTCEEVGALLVYVKRPQPWGYDILETMVIVQDSRYQCPGFYGP